jgi:hypothetical protein
MIGDPITGLCSGPFSYPAGDEIVEGIYPPGRLGVPNLKLRDDQRGDPQMRKAVIKWGLEGRKEPTGLALEHKANVKRREDLLRQIGDVKKGLERPEDEKLVQECEAVERSLNKVSALRLQGCPVRARNSI